VALRACYENEEDDDDDRQRIVMEPIFDADSCVFFDLGAKRQDKSDAKRCYELIPYTRAEYEDEFSDDPTTWPKGIQQSEFDWVTPDIVWVCALYRVEEKTELVHFFRGLDEDAEDMRVTQAELDADENMLDELQATGFREVRVKRIKRRVVRKYLMSGGGILEDCGILAGRHIPIVPVFGKRWVVDGVERCMGHVRLAKDAQMLTNMLMSWLAEMAARFDMEKPILTPEQIAGHATMWSNDNVEKYPYLLINPILDPATGQKVAQPPVGYTKAPSIPPVMGALMQIAEQALQDLLGNQQAGEQLQPNISGKVVELIQNRLDMQVFIYMSNMAKAVQCAGEVWLSMAKELYVEAGRRMKTVSADGQQTDTIELHEPAVDEDSGEHYASNNLDEASFDVWADVGPSSSSKKAATVRAITSLASITADPAQQSVLTAYAIMNMDGEGMQDLRAYYRRQLVMQGVVKPTKDEQAEMDQAKAGQQPGPQDQALMAMANQANAEADQAHAKTLDTMAAATLKQAQTGLTKAQTVETMARATSEHVGQAVDVSDAVMRASTPPKTVTT
jgi:hypothetical protein